MKIQFSIFSFPSVFDFNFIASMLVLPCHPSVGRNNFNYYANVFVLGMCHTLQLGRLGGATRGFFDFNQFSDLMADYYNKDRENRKRRNYEDLK